MKQSLSCEYSQYSSYCQALKHTAKNRSHWKSNQSWGFFLRVSLEVVISWRYWGCQILMQKEWCYLAEHSVLIYYFLQIDNNVSKEK